MGMLALAFLLGDSVLQLLPTLPYVPGWMALSCMLTVLCILLRHRGCSILLMGLWGFSYSAWYAEGSLSHRVMLKDAYQPIMLTGIIKSIPKKTGEHYQLLFKSDTPFKKTLRLTWHAPSETLAAGQRWSLLARLQPLHSTANPGGMDFNAWSLVQGIEGLGYVLQNKAQIFLGDDPWQVPLTYLRQRVYNSILPLLPESPSAHWLPALLIGERQGIGAPEWQLLRATGTNHLMAIAGLHIGFVAAMTFTLFSWGWRYVPRAALYYPAQQVAFSAALIAALLYSMLADFSLPTLRASGMVSLLGFAYLSKRDVDKWHVFALVLLGVLLLNPLQILTIPFWLSFGTIALIFYGMGNRLAPGGWWWRHGRVQWVISIGLLPCSLFFFQEVAVIGVIANAIAIPWMLFTILPASLMGLILALLHIRFSITLFYLADTSLSLLLKVLDWLAHLPFALVHIHTPIIYMLLVLGAVLLLLSPLPGWLRAQAMFWLLPAFLFQPPRLAPGDVTITVLDVGQGLSMVVKTATHTLLYDAGAKWRESDMGERVIVPYFYQAGIKVLDALIISHDDNDHRGGAASILAAFPVTQRYASQEKAGEAACRYGDHWQWDGVGFAFLHPESGKKVSKNNGSCVLQISTSEHRILLPGDIEKQAEQDLLTFQREKLPATLMIAPHHGSRTSSSHHFIEAIAPKWVVYSIGFHNRYHFPHQTVVKAYADLGVKQLETAKSGMLQFSFVKRRPVNIYQYRYAHSHYWD